MDSKEKDIASLLNVIKQLDKNSGSIDERLMLARIYGNLCSVNQTKVFEDAYWEQSLTNCLWKEYEDLIPNRKESHTKELHILTECFSSGGHTRLLEDLIDIRGCGDVLIARQESSSREKLYINNESNIYAFTNKDASLRDIIEIAGSYKVIYLHIHPDDIVSSVAAGVLKKIFGKNIKIIFVNHADHIFSFGFEYVDAIAEIGLNGFNINKVYRKNKGKKSFFLGIPICFDKSKINSFPKMFDQNKEMLIVSSGAGYKYNPFGSYDFPLFIEKLLNTDIKFKLVVLGIDRNSEYWDTLKKYENIKLLESVPYQEYLNIIQDADLYLDSWPLFGGRTLSEIWANNKIVTGLNIPILGVSALQKSWFKDDCKLLSAIKDFYKNRENSEIYKLNISQGISESFVLNHSFSNVAKRLSKVVDFDEINFEYFTEYDLKENDSLFFYEMWKNNNKCISLPFNWKYLVHKIIENFDVTYLAHLLQNMTKDYILSEVSKGSQAKVSILNKELEGYKIELDNIYTSFGWKILKPVRCFSRVCHKILGVK